MSSDLFQKTWSTPGLTVARRWGAKHSSSLNLGRLTQTKQQHYLQHIETLLPNGAKHSPSSFPWTALRDENVILRLTVTLVEKLKYFVILAWHLIWDLTEGVINMKNDMTTLLWSGFRMTTSITGVCNTQGFFAEKNEFQKIIKIISSITIILMLMLRHFW